MPDDQTLIDAPTPALMGKTNAAHTPTLPLSAQGSAPQRFDR